MVGEMSDDGSNSFGSAGRDEQPKKVAISKNYDRSKAISIASIEVLSCNRWNFEI